MTEQVGRAGAVYNVAIGAVAQLFSVVEVLKVQVHTYRFRYTFVNNLHHFSTLCAASSLSFFLFCDKGNAVLLYHCIDACH